MTKKSFPFDDQTLVASMKDAIRLRDNNKCVICNIRHLQPIVRSSSGEITKITPSEVSEYKEAGLKAHRVKVGVYLISSESNPINLSSYACYCPRCKPVFNHSK